MSEPVRHIPPCDDPACMPCWWDALDAEVNRVVAALRPGETPRPVTTTHLPGDADG